MVPSDTLLSPYLLGLLLLEAVAGKNQHWLIRSKHLLPSSKLVHQTSESNCCSVNGDSHRYLYFLRLLLSEVLALLIP